MRTYAEILELQSVLGRLAKYASFSAGKALALALAPAHDLEEVRHRQDETAEARKLMDVKPDFSLGGVHDLRPSVENALRGARLLPQDLLDVRDTLRRVRTLRRSLLQSEPTFPRIAALARQLEPCPEVAREIDRCIGDGGDVLDRASQTLSRVRAELRVAHDRLMDKLNKILTNPQLAPYLQEAYVTQRDGRYVVPIKTDFKGRIPGLIHDQSASGVTSFIEPMATVELNNRWRELQLAEEREVERILLALSAVVADSSAEIQRTVEGLAQLDLTLAKAKYANGIRATMPEMVAFHPSRPSERGKSQGAPHPGSMIDLRQARHPLLDPATVVPIDVHFDEGAFIIVITGPNTGGKTVSLKTVGLLALMAQCGLHLPAAEGSRLTVFEHICADIGDEQSIEQSLSTFSSHMSQILRILDQVDDRSLVLLDELGAGTDPLEGAALAQSLLIHLRQRRVTTLATTHYPELKGFAHQTPGVTNASVQFDLETLSPTYQLTIGLPGQSNAFAIATRLGLAEPIVRRAQGLMSDTHLSTERFLSEIKETQAEVTEAQAQAERARQEATKTAEELASRLAGVERERASILDQAREQAEAEVEAARKELRAIRQRLAMMAGAPELSEIESRLAELSESRMPGVSRSAAGHTPGASMPASAPVGVGDTVWVAGLNATGQVLALDESAAEVQVGAFRVRTRLESVELRHKVAAVPRETGDERVTMPPAPVVDLELHLRGLRVEEALPRLEKYLDDASRARVPFVRIVHGKGTGTMRRAVREHLREHPLVVSFRSGGEGEGDTGVTVVNFANT